jgi:hypothetical protein
MGGQNMVTYKNDFKKEEDQMLWELHEIRHQLAEEHESMLIGDINKKANEYWEKLKKRNSERIHA